MSYRGEIGALSVTWREADRVSLEWEVPGFLSLDAERGDQYESPYFDACGGRWRLCIFPNGMSEWTSGEWCDLIVWRLRSVEVQTFTLTAGIRGVEGRRIPVTKEMSPRSPSCSWLPLCRRSEVKDGESLVITLDVMIREPRDPSTQTEQAMGAANVPTEGRQDSSTQTEEAMGAANVPTEGRQDSSTQTDGVCQGADVHTEDKSPEKKGMTELQESLHALLAGGEDSDCILKVGGKEFPAHRGILRARSPVFRAMFAHDTLETQSGVITIGDCDQESFLDFLEHIYTGSTQMISASNVFSLFFASDKYDFDVLKKACAYFMKSNITVSSFCDTITLAVRHGEEELVRHATEFFYGNTLEILKTVEWQIFLKENTTIGNELLIKAFSK